MRQTAISAIVILLSILSSVAKAGSVIDRQLIEYRLDVENKKFYTIKNGKKYYDSLAAYKENEQLYVDLLKKVNRSNATYDDLKRFIFYGYISFIKNAGAPREALATDLMPVFYNNKSAFLKALANLKIMQYATCYYMGNYFGFEGRHKGGYPKFIIMHKVSILRALGMGPGKACIKTMKLMAR